MELTQILEAVERYGLAVVLAVILLLYVLRLNRFLTKDLTSKIDKLAASTKEAIDEIKRGENLTTKIDHLAARIDQTHNMLMEELRQARRETFSLLHDQSASSLGVVYGSPERTVTSTRLGASGSPLAKRGASGTALG